MIEASEHTRRVVNEVSEHKRRVVAEESEHKRRVVVEESEYKRRVRLVQEPVWRFRTMSITDAVSYTHLTLPTTILV